MTGNVRKERSKEIEKEREARKKERETVRGNREQINEGKEGRSAKEREEDRTKDEGS